MDAPKIGQKIKIISLSPNPNGIPDPSEQQYIGKTGIINYIDDAGTIWGTWVELDFCHVIIMSL